MSEERHSAKILRIIKKYAKIKSEAVFIIQYYKYCKDRQKRGVSFTNERPLLSNEQKRIVKERLTNNISHRVNSIHRNLSLIKERQIVSTTHSNTLSILGFNQWDRCFKWLNSMLCPECDIDLFTCSNLTGQRLVDIGHIKPIGSFDRINDKSWFMRANHHTNLGPQLTISNGRYLAAQDIYPREWQGRRRGGWKEFPEGDTQDMKQARRVYNYNEKRMYDAMSDIRKLTHGGVDPILRRRGGRMPRFYQNK